MLGRVFGINDDVVKVCRPVKAIKEWQQPQTVKDVRALLGSANYYRWLIPHYSDNVSPLTDLTRTKNNVGKGIEWGSEQEAAFQWIKDRFITDVAVTQFRSGWPTILETDAWAYAYASVISQRNPETGDVRPVVFHSGKFKDAEKRWPIRDKELYAIVNAFDEF